MTDRREDSLSRIYDILADLDDFERATRNLDQFPAGLRPAVNLFDGPELTVLPQEGSVLSFNAPLIIEARPKISILVGDTPGLLGPKINALVAVVKKAILTDATLQTVVEGVGGGTRGNGRVVYLGLTPFLGASLTIDADVELEFGIYYRLSPASL